MNRFPRTARVASGVVAALAVGLLTAGCGGSDAALDGGITIVAPADRKDPVSFSGTGIDGAPISLDTYRAEHRGEPVVVNVWGSWCGPCVAEADTLAKVSQDTGVPFLGIDVQDNDASARAFNAQHGITYPSVSDSGGQTLLAFRDYPIQATPSTVVLDALGRVAAVVSGAVDSASTLSGLIEDVQAETAGTPSPGSSSGTPTGSPTSTPSGAGDG